MGKTVAYIRVSTEEQQAKGTLENQLDSINLFSSSRGIEVDEWLEETQSGVDSDRPEFQRLSQGIIDGLYSTVIVAALDRLSRAPLQTLQFIENLQKAKANFYLVRENIAISDGKADFAAELFISMMSAFAKNERETIRARTMEGKRRKQNSGKWVTGQAPLGYELDRQTKILKVNAAEAAIIRLIFNLRVDGLGALGIVKRLNAINDPLYEWRYGFEKSRYCKVSQKQKKAGYCRVRHFHQEYQGCPGCAQKYGGINITGTSWSPTLIKKALKSRVYLGEIRIQGEWIAGAHEPIIDTDTFDTVQHILREEFHHPYNLYPANPLSGLIRCHCGRRMYVTTSNSRISKVTGQPLKKYWAFTCPAKKVGKCTQPNVPVEKVRIVSLKYVDKVLQSDKTAAIVRKIYDRIISEGKEAPADVKDLKKQLQSVAQELKTLGRAYLQAARAEVKDQTLSEMVQSMKTLQEQQDSFKQKIQFLEVKAATLRENVKIISPEQLLAEASRLWMFFSKRPLEGNEIVARMLRAFIREIHLYGKAHVVFFDGFEKKLLEAPLHKLVQAVLRLQEIGENVQSLSAEKEDTSFL